MTNYFLSVGLLPTHFIYRFLYVAFSSSSKYNTMWDSLISVQHYVIKALCRHPISRNTNQTRYVGCRILRCDSWIQPVMPSFNKYLLFASYVKHFARRHRDGKGGAGGSSEEGIWAFGAGQLWIWISAWGCWSHHWTSLTLSFLVCITETIPYTLLQEVNEV